MEWTKDMEHAACVADNERLTADNEDLNRWLAEEQDANVELRMQLDDARRKAEMYRRQLGGTTAALARARQRIRELEGVVA